jgi:PAS domain S-box-containing protein
MSFDGEEVMVASIIDRSENEAKCTSLLAKQAELERYIGQVPDLVFRVAQEPSPHFEFMSPSSATLLGYPPGELLQNEAALNAVLHRDDRTYFLSGVRSEPDRRNVVRFLHRDGRVLWMVVQLTSDPRQCFSQSFEGVAHDITRQLEHEQALEETIELLHSVIDHAPVIVWSLDRHGQFELSEGKGLQSLRLASGRVVGQSVWDLYAPYPQIIEATKKALQGQVVDGTWDLGFVQFDFHYAPHFDNQGRPSGATGVAVDVTRRHRAEYANQQLLTAIEQAAEAVVVTDQRGCVNYVNPAYVRTSGYDRLQILGKPWKDCEISQELEFLATLEQVLSTGIAWSGRIHSKRATGAAFDEDVTLSPIRDHKEAILGAVAVKRDITDQLRWEEQLRQSQKMEAVGQLAGGIAHDFNNFLQIIRGNLELLINQPLDEYPQHLVDDISHATDRAAKLVRQLLAFSRKDPVEFVPLRLDRVIFALLGMLRRLLGEDIEIEWMAGKGSPHVRANAPQLEQVVVNLCVNARDAMPSGGRLRISIDNKPLAMSLGLKGSDQAVEHYAVLAIQDNGEGMSAEVRQRIFEPFFTTKGSGKGTGLGLATVYAIMERHGGFIDVTSEPGAGTSFFLYFPLVEGKETPSGTFEVSRSVEGNNRLVLVAEDDPQIRNLTARFLARTGFRVVTAMDGAEADVLVERNSSELSLVILDAIMPHLSGSQVYRRMRARGSKIPCLIVTGYDFQSLDPIPDPEHTLVLQKPFDGRQLFDKLAQLLGEN